ncbi:MAG: FHA domain-containing protein [Luteimonas sp.]
MDSIKLRFSGPDAVEYPLSPGVHAVGLNGPDGTIGVVDDSDSALVRFCVDRRGVWMTVGETAQSVHVNGRPVRRMAMLRRGDAVYVDGFEMLLASGQPVAVIPSRFDNSSEATLDLNQADLHDADPRVVLRGVGGQYHGRSFTLERPRLVGRCAESDVRIDDAAFAERHARIELHGESVVLRDLGSDSGSVVNGERVRDAMLNPGDQVVFNGQHRFVIEAPARVVTRDESAHLHSAPVDDSPLPSTTRRLPWLLLAALLIAAALSGLLLFGASS